MIQYYREDVSGDRKSEGKEVWEAGTEGRAVKKIKLITFAKYFKS